jgi:hypothetical protein
MSRLHHYRRYHRRQLAALFDPAAWEILYLNYTNVAVFPRGLARAQDPGMLLARLGARSSIARTEDRLPPAWLNALLRRLFVGLAKMKAAVPVRREPAAGRAPARRRPGGGWAKCIPMKRRAEKAASRRGNRDESDTRKLATAWFGCSHERERVDVGPLAHARGFSENEASSASKPERN